MNARDRLDRVERRISPRRGFGAAVIYNFVDGIPGAPPAGVVAIAIIFLPDNGRDPLPVESEQ